MSGKIVSETHLYCPRCGTVHVIFRKANKLKKEGHYKNYYCYKCKHEHNHIELKTNYCYDADTLGELVCEMKAAGKFD